MLKFEPLKGLILGFIPIAIGNVFWNLLLYSIKFAPAMIERRERTRSLLLLPSGPNACAIASAPAQRGENKQNDGR